MAKKKTIDPKDDLKNQPVPEGEHLLEAYLVTEAEVSSYAEERLKANLA